MYRYRQITGVQTSSLNSRITSLPQLKYQIARSNRRAGYMFDQSIMMKTGKNLILSFDEKFCYPWHTNGKNEAIGYLMQKCKAKP